MKIAKDVWSIDEGNLSYEDEAMRAHAKKMIFPIGEPNDKFAQYFTGKSFLAPVSTSQVGIFNVTFEPVAGITGIFIMQKAGEDRFLSALQDVDTIRKKEKKQ